MVFYKELQVPLELPLDCITTSCEVYDDSLINCLSKVTFICCSLQMKGPLRLSMQRSCLGVRVESMARAITARAILQTSGNRDC